jgi:hypothetical protein
MEAARECTLQHGRVKTHFVHQTAGGQNVLALELWVVALVHLAHPVRDFGQKSMKSADQTKARTCMRVRICKQTRQKMKRGRNLVWILGREGQT